MQQQHNVRSAVRQRTCTEMAALLNGNGTKERLFQSIGRQDKGKAPDKRHTSTYSKMHKIHTSNLSEMSTEITLWRSSRDCLDFYWDMTCTMMMTDSLLHLGGLECMEVA